MATLLWGLQILGICLLCDMAGFGILSTAGLVTLYEAMTLLRLILNRRDLMESLPDLDRSVKKLKATWKKRRRG